MVRWAVPLRRAISRTSSIVGVMPTAIFRVIVATASSMFSPFARVRTGTTKKPPSQKRDGGLKPTAVPPSLTAPMRCPLCRTDCVAAVDTRLQVTVETPAPSTPLARFGAQLPDPFPAGFAPGFHPPWLAAVHLVACTRSVRRCLIVFDCVAQYATGVGDVK